MILSTSNTDLSFYECPIEIKERDIVNVFSKKNNKSLYETVSGIKPKNKYKKYKQIVELEYEEYKNCPLGDFLLYLKNSNNSFYEKFLNRYGDSRFCTFGLMDTSVLGLRGLYCYCVDNKPMYIGRCLDDFGKRINLGYGKIHPKNCYIDGQQTNCHINNLVNSVSDKISLFLCPLTNEGQIKKLEQELIGQINPLWNIALRTKH